MGDKPFSLHFLTILSYLSLLSAVANGLAYGFGFVGVIQKLINANDASDFTDVWYFLFLNLYGMCFALMVVLIEIRYKNFFKHFPGFKNWAWRGLFLIFVAILALGIAGEGSPFTDPDANKVFSNVREILAYIMFGIGMAYLIGEILCIRKRMQNTKNKYVEDSTFLQSSLV